VSLDVSGYEGVAISFGSANNSGGTIAFESFTPKGEPSGYAGYPTWEPLFLSGVESVVDPDGATYRGAIPAGVTVVRARATALTTLDVVVTITATKAGGATVPKGWSVEHRPAATTQATISRAAIIGGGHVCTSITVTVVPTVAEVTAGGVVFVLRDGATGAGTVLWSTRIIAAAGTSQVVTLGGLNIKGSNLTAMTLESTGAPTATNFVAVSMTGYTELA